MPIDHEIPVGDPQEDGEEYTICQYCGADLLWHRCAESERVERGREP